MNCDDDSNDSSTRQLFDAVEEKITDDLVNLEGKYYAHGILWKPRILKTWSSVFNKIPYLLHYFMVELPSELKKFNECYEKEDVLTRIIQCSDRGKFIEKMMGDILGEEFSFNHRNYYPDYVLSCHNYLDYLKPSRESIISSNDRNPRLILNKFVSNIPDGLEVKTSSVLGTTGGFVQSHGPQCGLHVVLSYIKHDNEFMKICQIWIGYISEEDKILRNRNKDTTTIKYVFHTNKLHKLL